MGRAVGRTTAKGYGAPHQKLREQWARVVARGGVVCTRYKHPQFPSCVGVIDPAEPWELGHHDTDRSTYTGPEHRSCNRRAGALKRQGRLGTDTSSLQW